MKKFSKPFIVAQVFIGLVLVSIGGYLIINNLDSSSVSEKEIQSRIELLDKLKTDSNDEASLALLASEKGYEVYEPSTFNSSYAYYKESESEVENVYDKTLYKEGTHYLMKNVSAPVENATSFLYVKNYEDTAITISGYNLDNNTLLVEQKIYTDCTVDECTASNTIEINYVQYLYSVEQNTLNSINSTDNSGELTLDDVSKVIDEYFDGLKGIYN